MPKLKIGDTVERLAGCHNGMRAGDTDVVKYLSHYALELEENGTGHDPCMFRTSTPRKVYIIAKKHTDGTFAPHIHPDVYANMKAAKNEAKRLAKALGDKFVIFKAIAEASACTEVNYKKY